MPAFFNTPHTVMPIVVNGPIEVRWPANIDNRFGPWESLAAAKAGIVSSRRALKLLICVGDALYWWKDNTTDDGLVAYAPVADAPYKEYVAQLGQAGTDAPWPEVINNTLGGNIAWTRTSAGQYVGTLSGATMPYEKTFILPKDQSFHLADRTANFVQTDLDKIGIFVRKISDGELADLNQVQSIYLEIRVYP